MINTYFSDTEAVEACICRLNVTMWCNSTLESKRCQRPSAVNRSNFYIYYPRPLHLSRTLFVKK